MAERGDELEQIVMLQRLLGRELDQAILVVGQHVVRPLAATFGPVADQFQLLVQQHEVGGHQVVVAFLGRGRGDGAFQDWPQALRRVFQPDAVFLVQCRRTVIARLVAQVVRHAADLAPVLGRIFGRFFGRILRVRRSAILQHAVDLGVVEIKVVEIQLCQFVHPKTRGLDRLGDVATEPLDAAGVEFRKVYVVGHGDFRRKVRMRHVQCESVLGRRRGEAQRSLLRMIVAFFQEHPLGTALAVGCFLQPVGVITLLGLIREMSAQQSAGQAEQLITEKVALRVGTPNLTSLETAVGHVTYPLRGDRASVPA